MVDYFDRGDIFNLPGVLNFAHGCNCAGAMGRGIALQFRTKWPEMHKQYKNICRSGDFNIGDVFAYNYGPGYVFNLATQKTWRHGANIGDLKKALENLLNCATSLNIKKISMPAIGSGLGGLNWNNVKEAIETTFRHSKEVDLYVVEHFYLD